MEETPIINVLCYKLPQDVSKAVYNEFESRKAEIYRIWENVNSKFAVLAKHEKVVMLILSMSIYYRRILCNFEGAEKFYDTVNRNALDSKGIVNIGAYKLDETEKNKLLRVTISFNKLIENYGIGSHMFNYTETVEFLQIMLNFLHSMDSYESGKESF